MLLYGGLCLAFAAVGCFCEALQCLGERLKLEDVGRLGGIMVGMLEVSG